VTGTLFRQQRLPSTNQPSELYVPFGKTPITVFRLHGAPRYTQNVLHMSYIKQ